MWKPYLLPHIPWTPGRQNPDDYDTRWVYFLASGSGKKEGSRAGDYGGGEGSEKRSSDSAVPGVPVGGAGGERSLWLQKQRAACPGSESRSAELTAGKSRASTQDLGRPRVCVNAETGGSWEGPRLPSWRDLQPPECFSLTQRRAFWTGILYLTTCRDKRVK